MELHFHKLVKSQQKYIYKIKKQQQSTANGQRKYLRYSYKTILSNFQAALENGACRQVTMLKSLVNISESQRHSSIMTKGKKKYKQPIDTQLLKNVQE